MLANGCQSGLIRAILAPIEANRDGTPGSQVTSPWIKILNRQAAILASLGDRLGLDPKSRAALKLPNARQQKSKFEGLIGAPVYRPLSN